MYTKQGVCSNCSTTVTPLWRRGTDGSYLCNACGLYFKIHKKHRPTELKTDTFRQRNRFRKDFITEIPVPKRYYVDQVLYDHRVANINFYDSNYDLRGGNKKLHNQEKHCMRPHTFSLPRMPYSGVILNKSVESNYCINSVNNGKRNILKEDEENNEAIAVKVLLSLSKIHPY